MTTAKTAVFPINLRRDYDRGLIDRTAVHAVSSTGWVLYADYHDGHQAVLEAQLHPTPRIFAKLDTVIEVLESIGVTQTTLVFDP